MRRTLSVGLSVAVLVLVSLTSWAQQAPDRELGLLLGAGFPDRDLTGLPQTAERESLLLGLRAATATGDHLQLYGDLTVTRYNESANQSLDVNEYALRVGPELVFGKRAQFFMALGIGWAQFDPSQGSSYSRGIGSLGVGQRFILSGSDALRWELRAENAFLGSSGSGPGSFTNLQLLLGYSFGTPPRDSDGDGVPDKKDTCPGTPTGATVNAIGCPSDEDGDGVWNGIDRCPGTPRGARVDAAGCPKDSDGDGVWDGIDRCPDTPRGATVDVDGCPKDSDGDGVWDGIDRCPDTPRGATADAVGCPKDSDGDGVWDGIDRCPDTPRGTKVDVAGCPVQAPTLFEAGKKVLVLEGVSFESDRAVLVDASRAVLDRVAISLKDWPDVRVEVAGHTDSTNTAAHNQKLSEQRAEAVRAYLIGQGVAADQLTAKGYGESSPIADNATPAGRKVNRRVELQKLN